MPCIFVVNRSRNWYNQISQENAPFLRLNISKADIDYSCVTFRIIESGVVG